MSRKKQTNNDSSITIFNRAGVLRVLERIKLRLLDFKAISPVIIYQMGKVGSTSVYNMVQTSNLKNPVFHIHYLSPEGIKNAEKFFRNLQSKKIPHHLKLSKIIRRKIERTTSSQIKIITLVRDPIIRDISDLFQNLASHHSELLDKNAKVENIDIYAFLNEHFIHYDQTTNYTCTWFDNEFKNAFGIDIFTHPFNHQDRFCIIAYKNIDLLILRLEDLDSSFNKAVNQFLSKNLSFKKYYSNVGKNKKYAEIYSDILKNFALPRDLCEKIYSSKYARHFYSKDERLSFIQR